jgi:multidrug resistance efflux pump
LLANVNPTFNWVRLAQRVPVRIALDRAARGELVAGATATVEVLGPAQHADRHDDQAQTTTSQHPACKMKLRNA